MTFSRAGLVCTLCSLPSLDQMRHNLRRHYFRSLPLEILEKGVEQSIMASRLGWAETNIVVNFHCSRCCGAVCCTSFCSKFSALAALAL